MKRKRNLHHLWICFAMLLFLAVPFNVKAAAATTPVSISVQYGQTEARTILNMINELRTSSTDAWYWNPDDTTKTYCTDLQPLQYDYDLEKTAMQRAAEIALIFSHTRPDDSRCFSIYPYGATGENIAAGYISADAVNTGWREDNLPYASQGHRRNMLNSNSNCVGIGHVYYNGYHYWVEAFGRKNTINTTPPDESAFPDKVSISVAASKLLGLQVTFDRSEYSIKIGESTPISISKVAVNVDGHWPSDSPAPLADATPVLTVNDTSIVQYDGSITGLSEGTTALTASLIGLTANPAVTIKVHDCKNHWDNGTVTVEPTCTSAGNKSYTCTVCGTSRTETLSALGHDYNSEWTVDAVSTCTTPGQKSRHCTRCDSVIDIIQLPRNTEHTWDNGTITTPATVDTEGVKTYTCQYCGAVKTESISRLPYPSIPIGTKLFDPWTGNLYKITSSNYTSQTVSFTGNKMRYTVTIPNTVLVDDIPYKVTAISASAFKNNRQLKKVVIGTNIAKIGKNAFYGCKNLTSVTIKSSRLTLKNVGTNAFKNTSPKTTVKVPKKQKALYKQILKKRGLNKKAKIK